MAKSKKYFNKKNKSQDLKAYLENQKMRQKHFQALQQQEINQVPPKRHSMIHQQFQLPLYGKSAYIYGFMMKYCISTLFFSICAIPFLSIFEDVLFPHTYRGANIFLEHFWYFFFLIPLALHLSLIPFTIYRKNLIKNHRVSEDSLDIIYANNAIKSIAYTDITYASSQSAGTAHRIFMISYYCRETNQHILNYQLFIEHISFYNIYPINNENQMISALLQQLKIKNKNAYVNPLFLYFYHIDSKTFELDHRAVFKDKLFWSIFWGVLLSMVFATLFYNFYTS